MDTETRRQKQQQLIVRMVERKVRERARQLYNERGQRDGQALKDWFQAEEEVIGNTAVGPLYRRMKRADQTSNEGAAEGSAPDPSAYESHA